MSHTYTQTIISNTLLTQNIYVQISSEEITHKNTSCTPPTHTPSPTCRAGVEKARDGGARESARREGGRREREGKGEGVKRQ